jgi:hypothetical protein
MGAQTENGPAETPSPGTRTTKECFMATTDSSAPAHLSPEEKLAKLEDQLRHELMDDEERMILRDRVLRLRRRLSR